MVTLNVEPASVYRDGDLVSLGMDTGSLDGLRKYMASRDIQTEQGYLGAWVVNYLSRNNGDLEKPVYVNAFTFAEHSKLGFSDVLTRRYGGRPLTLVVGENGTEDVVVDSRDLHLFYYRPKEGLDKATRAVIEYQDRGTKEALETAFGSVHDTIESILIKFVARLPQKVEIGDLWTPAYFGFLDAANGFDREAGFTFNTYLGKRVIGAVLDELRLWDDVPRLDRTKGHVIEKAREGFFADHGREPTEKELCQLTGFDVDNLRELERDLTAFRVFSLDEPLNSRSDGSNVIDNKSLRKIDYLASTKDSPLNMAIGNEAEMIVKEEIGRAFMEIKNSKEQAKYAAIYELYYFEGLSMKEIGERLDLSESRICQLMTDRVEPILNKAKRRIAERLGEDLDLVESF